MGEGLESARFFVDANDLALASGLTALRRDVVYPGHPGLPGIVPGTPDEEWIEVVGSRRLVVLSRDKKLRTRPVQRGMWRAGAVRGFLLTSSGQLGTWESVRALARWRDEVEGIITECPTGPWVYAITKHRAPREMRLVDDDG